MVLQDDDEDDIAGYYQLEAQDGDSI